MPQFILIENCKTPILIELTPRKNKGGYVVFRKSNLEKLPKKLLVKLFTMGLYEKIESAKNDFDNLFSLHRLVMCCYTNIVGLKVHHIIKDVRLNNICNIIPLTQSKHTKIDNMPIEKGIKISRKIQKQIKEEIFKKPRKTLAQNARLIVQILKWRDE